VADFSMRRVSAACGVSCAAPYKHFENRRDFIAAIIGYVNGKWQEVQEKIIAETGDDTKTQIIELSVNYVKFLVENPQLRSILMLKEDGFDNTYHKKSGEVSSLSQKLIEKYCEENNIDDKLRESRTFTIRALIFGCALMVTNGELECDDNTINMLREALEKEFTY
jgi:AcrR family transcriptional regulator